MGSALVADVSPIRSFAAAGWINWDLSLSAHQLNPATNGNVFHGLPVTGFAATKFVNGAVSTSTGAVLANYSAFYRHRGTTVCTNANGSCR